MKIAMFGGSFDPVHNDHVGLCRLMTERFKLDKVYVVPAACSPFKDNTASADFHRLEMCKVAFENEKNVIVSDFEIQKGGKSYTVDTLRYLKTVYPDGELYLITGADAFLTLSSWYCASDIFKMAHILTVVRDDDDISVLKSKAQEYLSSDARCSFVDTPVGGISSSMIRRMIADNKDVSCFLPEKVFDYIRNNRLYGYGN